jgi:UDP-glucose 4-epimerase
LQDVDFVFHFAGMLLLSAAENPRECLINNICGMYDFLEMFIKHNVKKLVYSSSISIYGSSRKKILMDENYPLNNRTMYGASKIIAEQFCRVLNDTDGLNYLALRYSSVYGPRQHYEGLYPRLIMNSLDRIEKNFNPQIQGKGDEVQDFIYAEDVAEANILALKSDISDEAINIVSEIPTTTKKLIQTLIDITKPELEIEYISRSDKKFVPYRWFSGKKARELLSFTAQTELKDGLKKLIEWKRQIN